jgi:ubiquinone/menaquinone biosynthesis C-methylase UbiE
VRFGGDTDFRQKDEQEFLHPVRDEVLSRVRLGPDETLLDVGTGDGLIAFEALERTKPSGVVIFSDISSDLLAHCKAVATAANLLDRCRFVRASADSLQSIEDASVDAVTTRSVLIYVRDKASALAQFYRVLRPGGRVSLFEPINSLALVHDPGRFLGYDVRPVAGIAAKVQALYDSIQPPGVDASLNFNDRDLFRYAEEAGFQEICLELRVNLKSVTTCMPWALFLRRSSNPLAPPVGEAIDRVLTAREAAILTNYLKPLVESGAGHRRTSHAYMTAAKTLPP